MKFNKEDIVFLSLVTAVIFAICGLLIYCNHAIDERDLTIEQMEIKIEELYQENSIELKNRVMRIKGRDFKISTFVCLVLYYGIAYWMPASCSLFGGTFFKHLRAFLCRHIFLYCGKNVNIERKANFGSGLERT